MRNDPRRGSPVKGGYRMSHRNIDKLGIAELETNPFEHVIVSGFLTAESTRQSNGTYLENYVAEVPPDNGTLLVFKRAENSWHGHHPFEGQRRALQMNWMTSEGSKGFHAIRHKLSAAVKKLMAT